MKRRSSIGTLIGPEELHELLTSKDPAVRILDVRWRLDQPDGRPEYLRGHIPGAVYADLGSELSETGRPPTEGRHPLPSIETLQTAARRWGLNEQDTIVVYDDAGNTSATRAWWLLRHAGVSGVRVLDGSLQGWVRSGFALETGEVRPVPGTITLQYSTEGALIIDEAAKFSLHGTLLDVRAPERYRGEHEPIDPRAGHIPGAINASTADNLDRDGQFLSPEALREQFIRLGVDPQKPVATYCGSGINAAHAALALELAGFDAVLYPGSFSEWSNNYDREIVTGDQPG